MASDMVLSDLDAQSAGHGIIGNSTCISMDNLEEKTHNLIRSGFLWKRNVGQSSTRTSSRARFFVLTKSTLEYYRNEKCVSGTLNLFGRRQPHGQSESSQGC